jgi:hypothetical protein
MFRVPPCDTPAAPSSASPGSRPQESVGGSLIADHDFGAVPRSPVYWLWPRALDHVVVSAVVPLEAGGEDFCCRAVEGRRGDDALAARDVGEVR